MAKERDLLLQKDIDPAEENLIDRAILLVHADRGVKRQQGDVPSEPRETGGEGIVAQTTAAVHASSSGGDIDNFGVRFHSISLSRITPSGHHSASETRASFC